MIMFLWILLLVSSLHYVSSWDLKAPAEKYWNMKRLGLKEGHEVPFELPSYSKYYHYHHQQQQPAQQQQSYIHQSNRIPYFEKTDRSIPANHRSPAGCAYKGRKYSHTEEVVTSQACLNCTCQRGFVSCFLRVCPVLNPPDDDDSCYLLKEPGTCCAVLKCSGLAGSSSTTTKKPSSAYHFNPSNKNSDSFFTGNSVERKALEPFGRQTTRQPFKDFWTSIRPTSRHQPQRPFLRATPRPFSYAPVGKLTTTQRPLNRNGFPAPPTFSQRRPNYPVSVTSKPTLRRTMYTTTIPSRKTTATLTSSTSLSPQLSPPVQSSAAKDDDEASSGFFRMSSILV